MVLLRVKTSPIPMLRTDLPSIYILRRPTDPLPDRSKCTAGDIVIMSSGDVMVMDGPGTDQESMWILLPGRYLTLEELKAFVGYVSSGWPPDPTMIKDDIAALISNERFVAEMGSVCAKINLSASKPR